MLTTFSLTKVFYTVNRDTEANGALTLSPEELYKQRYVNQQGLSRKVRGATHATAHTHIPDQFPSVAYI